MKRETALEQLRTILAAVSGIASAVRGPVEFEDVDPAGWPIAIIVGPDDEFVQGPAAHTKTKTKAQIQVWHRFKTTAQLETLRRAVLTALFDNGNLGNTASSLFVLNLEWIDSFENMQGFVINVEINIVKEDFSG